jgi:UDP-N-acetylglucosamine transferase subunit ALG13
MKTEDSQPLLLKIEDKKKFEDNVMYIYAGTDAAAVHKPITVYKEKNASAYLVAGRYIGFDEAHLKYKSLNEEEQRLVVEKLGTGKIVRFLSMNPEPDR